MTRVALVLGGGGARGYAHIGVIEELHTRGFDIVGVAGTSMGALVGGLHVAGALERYTEWARSLNQWDVLRLMDPALPTPGMIRGERVLDIVREMVGDVLIEDLPIPFTAVATDLIAGRAVWFQRGKLDVAIGASIAIPGVIVPRVVDGRLFADGGVLEPLPLAPVAGVEADLVVAVDVGAESPDGIPVPGPKAVEEWIEKVRRGTAQLRERLTSADTHEDEPADDEPGVPRLGQIEILNRSFEITQGALTRQRLAAYPPDVLIEVPRTTARALDFNRASEIIEIGRKKAVEALDAGGY